MEDLKSTYGTYVGEEAILTSGNSSQVDKLVGKCVLQKNTRVRFGLQTTIYK